MRKLPDKTILITGGNDGIGRATAEKLAGRGLQLLIAGKDEVRGREAVSRLRHATGNEQVHFIHCDLADFASIEQAAMEVLSDYPCIDVLINNAGVYTDQRQLTSQGYELQFGVNHLGHFLLTKRLLPALLCAREARVLTISSDAHYHGQIDFASLQGNGSSRGYSGYRAYAQSKLANVLFSKEFGRRHPEIMANSLHPGLVRTRLTNKNGNWFNRIAWTMYKPFMRSSACGACTPVYLATSPEVRDVTGRYFDEKQCLQKPSPAACDEALAARLWEYSEEAVQVSRPL